jgi:hypothetical protein
MGVSFFLLYFLLSPRVFTLSKFLLFSDAFLSVVNSNTALHTALNLSLNTCDKLSGTAAKWFKIDQISKKSDGATLYLQVGSNRTPVWVILLSTAVSLESTRKRGTVN